jgi:small multidrug resistance pump
MNLYLILFVAIAFEVFGTMLLPASQNFTKAFPSIVSLISYGISFIGLFLIVIGVTIVNVYKEESPY